MGRRRKSPHRTQTSREPSRSGVAGWFDNGRSLDTAWLPERIATRVNAAQICLWVLLALPLLPNKGHFTYDQAYFYDQALTVIQQGMPAPYGPFISGSMALTPGGLVFSAYALPYVFGLTDPRWGVGLALVLSGVGLWLFDRSLALFRFAPTLRLAAVTFHTWSLWHARWTDTFWNINWMLFAAPALLWLTARTVSSKDAPLWESAAAGVLAALCIQTHISGVLLGAVCLAIVFVQRRDRLTLQRLAIALATFLVCYIPFFVSEWVTDFQVTAFLKKAPQRLDYGPPGWMGVRAPFMYASHAYNLVDIYLIPRAWEWAVLGGSLVVAVVLGALGIRQRFPLKWAVGMSLALMPLFFGVTRRPYLDHYVAVLSPLLVLLSAAGAASLLTYTGWQRWAASGYLVVFAVSSMAVVLSPNHMVRPQDPWNGHTLEVQLERTRRALAENRPHPTTEWEESAFVLWTLAKHVYKRELSFEVNGRPCSMAYWVEPYRRAPSPPPSRVVPVGQNTYLHCSDG